jgi:hypothetical protein
MIARVVAIAAALPTLLLGVYGLCSAFGVGFAHGLEGPLRAALDVAGLGSHLGAVRGTVPGGVVAVAGLGLLWIGLKPAPGKKGASGRGERNAQVATVVAPKRSRRSRSRAAPAC